MPDLQLDQVLDVGGAADYTKLHPATIRREAQRGNLRGTKVAGGRWRFRREDLLAYISGEEQAS